jgi:hypothetical protein
MVAVFLLSYPFTLPNRSLQDMTREKLDLLPVIDRAAPTKIIGVVTSEGVAYAYEKAKNLR